MKLLFISTAFPKESESRLRSYCKNIVISSAQETFQLALMEGFVQSKADFEVFSYPMLPSYPMKFKKMYFKEDPFVYGGKRYGKMFSYCTLPFIKDFSIKYRLRHRVKQWIKENNDLGEKLVVLTYTPSSFFIEALAPLKKKYPKLVIASIITELIDFSYMSAANKSFLKQIQQKRERKLVHKGYDKIDKFILLSKAMEERIPQARGRSMIMEGLYAGDFQDPNKSETKEKMLLYTGGLQPYVGVKELVDAFKTIDNSNIRLVICGAGAMADYIRKKSLEDNRIVYEGRVPRERALELQKEATALINPRFSTEEFTKYSFPSKTMEYMASGTPMIGFKLAGIPEEYYEHMYIVPATDTETIAKTVQCVLKLPSEELRNKGREAAQFIRDYKTAKHQATRVLNFLQS